MTTRTSLVLVGPMGAGKTSVGRLLAKNLGLQFIDSDRELEARCGASIPWIFDIEGEAGFRAREKDVIADLCSRGSMVLATGGGAVLAEENRRALRRPGIVVYLQATPEQIIQRIGRDSGRPLLEVENPVAVLKQIIAQRDPLYREVADVVVSAADQDTPQGMAKRVIDTLREGYPERFPE
jgi:shikimate kinase